MYEHETHPTWTLIKPICKYIQIESKFSKHYNKNTIFHSIGYNTYYTQGLTFDYLTFDPIDVYKHGLMYTTFFHVNKKRN